MKIIKHPSATEVIIEQIFSKAELNKLEEEILKFESKSVNIPGFRPGNAPLEKVREILIKKRKWEDLMGRELQEAIITEWSKENNSELGEIIRILDVKTTKSDPLTLECHFEYFPRLKEEELAEKYKKLKIEKKQKAEDFKVTDKEVDEGLAELQKRRTVLKPVNEPLGKDKYAFINISDPQDNTDQTDSKTNKDLFQWGIAQNGKEFDEKTEGMKEGEEKEIDKKKVKVEKIFTSEVPELNDEFAKSLGHFHNMEELKKSMKHGLHLEKLYQELEARRDSLIKSLIENIKLELPESIVKRSADNYQKDFERQMSQMGELHQNENTKEDKFGKMFEERAKRELKLQRILEAIALKEKIVPKDEEVEKELNKILQNFPSPKKAREALGDPDSFRSRVILSLCFDKTLQYLEKENGLTEDIQAEIDRIEKKEHGEHHHEHEDHICGHDCDHGHE